MIVFDSPCGAIRVQPESKHIWMLQEVDPVQLYSRLIEMWRDTDAIKWEFPCMYCDSALRLEDGWVLVEPPPPPPKFAHALRPARSRALDLG